MIAITKADATRYLQRAQSATAALKRTREHMTEVVEDAVAAFEMASTAFAFGIVNGRWGGVEFIGLPVDLWAGVGAHILGFAGIAPTHLHAIGNGAIGSYVYTLGAGIGREMREKAKLAGYNMSGGPANPAAVTSGVPNDAYLQQLARRAA